MPAERRVLPHVMVETSHPRAYATLSVLRKHDFITKSPAHTRALTISHRGYVEMHTKGLTEFYTMEQLTDDMSSYTLMQKLSVIQHFREYKIFRNWELVVRKRKFATKATLLEKKLLRSHTEHWACVMFAQAQCVSLMHELREKELKPLSTGFTMDALVKELKRRKEILEEALDLTRKHISEHMDK